MTNEEFIEFLDEAKESVDCTRFLVSGGKTSFSGMANEFKSGDKVKWLDRDNDSEILYGVVNTTWGGGPGRTCVQYDCDPGGNRWFKFVPTTDLRHADEVGLWAANWSAYMTADEQIVAPPVEKKGYQPDGFDREAFDDFMRNL